MAPALTPADRALLGKAVALAARGRYAVEPNPAVGAVVVRGGRVVGAGWHRAYGGAHAEVEALAAAGSRARGSTVYVSLEPCCTHGKTPPCTDALREAGVSRVVWAARDPNPAHGGRAARILRRAGVEASGPAAPAEGAVALQAFRRGLALDRPWVLLKWASSLDGRVSPSRGEGARLSGPRAQAWLHDLRGRVDAVAVGVGTVLADDPRLTCRAPAGPALGVQPAAVVFDSALRTPVDARLLREAGPGRPVYLVHAAGSARHGARLARRAGVFPMAYRRGPDGRPDPAAALRDLKALGVRRLLVEGGPTLAGVLLAAGLVDQVAVVVTPHLLGADDAPLALAGTPFRDAATAPRLHGVSVRRLGEDVLIQGYVARS